MLYTLPVPDSGNSFQRWKRLVGFQKFKLDCSCTVILYCITEKIIQFEGRCFLLCHTV